MTSVLLTDRVQTTDNIRAADYHTYYLSCFDVWVHNVDCFKSFIYGQNHRDNLKIYTWFDGNANGYDDHHFFLHKFSELFDDYLDVGFNYNDPSRIIWCKSTKGDVASQKSNAKEYNNLWEAWIKDNPSPTVNENEDQGAYIMNMFINKGADVSMKMDIGYPNPTTTTPNLITVEVSINGVKEKFEFKQ